MTCKRDNEQNFDQLHQEQIHLRQNIKYYVIQTFQPLCSDPVTRIRELVVYIGMSLLLLACIARQATM